MVAIPLRADAAQVVDPTRLKHKFSRNLKERFIELLLLGCGLVAVFTTVAITVILVHESIGFFSFVSVWDFITGTVWTPLFENPQYGILPLVSGTLTITFIAMLVAVPMGTVIAIYLSEFAPHTAREIIKPALELIQAVPTIVFGYFALLFVTPLLQATILPDLPGFNMLVPGLVIGVATIPTIASLSEDAMRAVPMAMREGAYALGSNKMQTALTVVMPAAISGVVAAFVLAAARAIGETMIVAIAAGQNANFTFNPLDAAATLTAYIAQVSMGDLEHGSVGYRSIFAAGLVLLIMTLVLNLTGHFLRRRYRKAY
ncbi:phosphate ABC transporter permease subunit PstC [Sphaerotilus sp.]|uniref:phosphate ABC transporter permease subunit PstC n=1 Tax=Sphaerotilus sp. TaxID=2093942 RepID=UPI002ACE6922|nr:phosphate ABC transporter permease subunit PstC [Sphaerotilus sp.]MDZ7855429.1 phosphate ABC transporter permease subunit PstC [Sphaerotilus sp.]